MTNTRQDILAATEVAKNKIIEKLVTKYDVQVACDTIKDEILDSIQTMRQEDKASLRQTNAMNDQIWRKLLSLEQEISRLRRELSSFKSEPADKIPQKSY